jgi:transaldolase
MSIKKGNRQSGDPRKRQAVKDIEICKILTKRKNEQRGLEIKAELAQKSDEIADEALHLLELFEEQNAESSAFLYDETYYMIIFTE